MGFVSLSEITKLEFSKKDGGVYENEQFRMYIQDGGVVLTTLDRTVYSDGNYIYE